MGVAAVETPVDNLADMEIGVPGFVGWCTAGRTHIRSLPYPVASMGQQSLMRTSEVALLLAALVEIDQNCHLALFLETAEGSVHWSVAPHNWDRTHEGRLAAHTAFSAGLPLPFHSLSQFEGSTVDRRRSLDALKATQAVSRMPDCRRRFIRLIAIGMPVDARRTRTFEYFAAKGRARMQRV